MNREEIIELVIDALNLIGCKHTYVPAGKQRVLDYVVLANPIGWYFNFWLDPNFLSLNFQNKDGHPDISTWQLNTIYGKGVIAEPMHMISKTNRKKLFLDSDSIYTVSVILEYGCSFVTEDFWHGAILSIVGESVDISTADKDLVPAARALLLGDCPEEVFLDMLCEKYDYINELRYAAF